MAEAIADCDALLCGGMGRGAYESMRARNIRPVVTTIASIDAAMQAYIEGRIVDQVERLH
jgi:predicted Fe-Mo cluster-binding NifX family protein